MVAYKTMDIKNNIVKLTCLMVFLMTACSHQQAYQAMQESGKSMAKCELIADYIERERCFAQFNKSYEEYKKEREEVIRHQE